MALGLLVMTATDCNHDHNVEYARIGDESRRIRIATFNVHHLYDTRCNSRDCGRYDFERVLSKKQYKKRIKQIAKAIDSMDADIVLLQEVENWDVLKDIQAELEHPFETIRLGEYNIPGSLNVAILAKGRLIKAYSHKKEKFDHPNREKKTSFTRDLLEVHLEIDGSHVIVFAAHFRSRYNDDPGQRLAEAQTARKIVIRFSKRYPDAIVILGGDLNDVPGSKAIKALEEEGILLRAGSELPLKKLNTYKYRKEHIAIDHLFISTISSGQYVKKSAHIIGKGGLAGSDHSALCADFILPPPSSEPLK